MLAGEEERQRIGACLREAVGIAVGEASSGEGLAVVAELGALAHKFRQRFPFELGIQKKALLLGAALADKARSRRRRDVDDAAVAGL